MIIYRVKNWAQIFENNKSRTIRQCSFVCVPNKQHGMGFCRVMSEPDGATIYGVWSLILGACSQQPILDRNGWLTSDGHREGTAWTPQDLALKFRRPEPEITRALDFLSSPQVDWIEKLEVPDSQQVGSQCPPSALVVPSQCPSGVLKEGRNEQKEDRESKSHEVELPAGFPKTEAEAECAAATVGCGPDFAAQTWNKAASRGGRDAKEVPIRSWAHYLRTEWTYEQARRHQKSSTSKNGHNSPDSNRKSTVWELSQSLKVVEEKLTKIRNRGTENAFGRRIQTQDQAEYSKMVVESQRLKDLIQKANSPE